ncbi:MAG: 2-phospho-L-lactate guanylyltransferase [Nocardioides sp.]
MGAMSEMSYAVLVPVKPSTLGKSRLGGAAAPWRTQLAAAFAIDTLAAARAAVRVALIVVITDDPAVTSVATAAGDVVLADPGAGLNAALRVAAQHVRHTCPDLTPAALLADHPALRPDELDDALAAVDPVTGGFVADSQGTGTALYAGGDFRPAFGADSRNRHRATGAAELLVAVPTLRLDVDDLDSLRAAIELGVGPATAQVLATAQLLLVPADD